jgi:hypothetical protein
MHYANKNLDIVENIHTSEAWERHINEPIGKAQSKGKKASEVEQGIEKKVDERLQEIKSPEVQRRRDDAETPRQNSKNGMLRGKSPIGISESMRSYDW